MAFDATYGTYWIPYIWPIHGKRRTLLFLISIQDTQVSACLPQKIRNSTVILHCDNLAIVTIINKQTSKHPNIMQIFPPLILVLLSDNIIFKAEHIPGLTNILFDKIA